MESGRWGEHRSRVRVRLEGDFLVTPVTAPSVDALRGQLRDLSCCGVGGDLGVYLPPGTAVRVRLLLNGDRSVEVRGLVARCEPKQGAYQTGVRFIDPPLDLKVSVSSLTTPTLKQPLPPHLRQLVQETRELRLTA
jgi:hypothetical protein